MKTIRVYTYYILFIGMVLGIAGLGAYYMSSNIADYHKATHNLLENIDNG